LTPEVRVIDDSGELLGVMPLAQALRLAVEKVIDLVEVNPVSKPPTCKLMDFSRYKKEGEPQR
jgi:translation initiation factor IF-3